MDVILEYATCCISRCRPLAFWTLGLAELAFFKREGRSQVLEVHLPEMESEVVRLSWHSDVGT